MRFDVRSTYYPVKSDPGCVLEPVVVDIYCVSSEEKDTEHLAGRIGMDRFPFVGLSPEWIAMICDNDSVAWVDIFEYLFDGDDIRCDVVSDHEVFELVFAHTILIHPQLDPCRLFILDHIFKLFTNECLGVIWEEVRHSLNVSDAEAASINLQRVDDGQLLIKPVWLESAFDRTDELSEDLSDFEFFEVTRETESWVLERWS